MNVQRASFMSVVVVQAGGGPASVDRFPPPVTVPATATPTAADLAITPAVLRAPIRFLADDLLEGRGPGTRGDRIARAYVASCFEMLGLQPGNGAGGWEQDFDLVGVTTRSPANWRFAARDGRVELADRRDFVAVAGAIPAAAIDGRPTAIEFGPAEVVFVGYGIEAPEFGWDDFKGVDVRGKVLLVLNDDPDWDPALFAGKRRLYYGRWTYKFENAARHGAAAAILIHTDASAGYPWQTVVTSWSGENSRLAGGTGPEVDVQAWITEDAARRVTATGGHDLDALVHSARSRDFSPVALGIRTALRVQAAARTDRTANVLGLLPGSDPALRTEVVILTAHHDHLGTKTGGDRPGEVYNGALDNAAGVAQLLAVARAFGSLPRAPRRSVLFLATAAEEQGLLGSSYYARHPTFPAGRIAANINFDGGNVWGRTTDALAIGFGKSSLDAVASASARRQGRTYGDEPFPEKGSFYRSDQLNFARIGVPALFLRTGIDFVGRPPGWGAEQAERWTQEHYHQPSDDFDPTWDLEGMVDDARLGFAIAEAVAEAPAMPTWNPGDEFEAARRAALSDTAGPEGSPSE